MSYSHRLPYNPSAKVLPEDLLRQGYPSCSTTGFPPYLPRPSIGPGEDYSHRSPTPPNPGSLRDYGGTRVAHPMPASMSNHYSSLELQNAGSMRRNTSTYSFNDSQEQDPYQPRIMPAQYPTNEEDPVAESWKDFRKFVGRIEPALFQWFKRGTETLSATFLERQLAQYLSSPLEVEVVRNDCARAVTPPREPRMPPPQRTPSKLKNRPLPGADPMEDLLAHNRETLNLLTGQSTPKTASELSRPVTPKPARPPSPNANRSATPKGPRPSDADTGLEPMKLRKMRVGPKFFDILTVHSTPEMLIEYCKDLYAEEERRDFLKTAANFWTPYADGELPEQYRVLNPPLMCSVVRCVRNPSLQIAVCESIRTEFANYIDFIVSRVADCLGRAIGACTLVCAEKVADVDEQSWELHPGSAEISAIAVLVLSSTGSLRLDLGLGQLRITLTEGSLVLIYGHSDAVMTARQTIEAADQSYTLLRLLFE